MKIKIDGQYRENIDRLSRRLKKSVCLFDMDKTLELGFSLEEDHMRIWYSTQYETDIITYSYKSLKRCEVHTNGYLLIFKDKKFVFLPVTDDEENDMELLDIGFFLVKNMIDSTSL